MSQPRSWALATLAGGLLLAATGCASTLSSHRDDALADVPATWSASDAGGGATATSLARWWVRFDDPVLTSLVGQAMQNNTTVVGAHAALRQARALRDVAAASLWPSLDGSASAQRSHRDRSTSNSFQAGLDARWELDIFGGNRQALNASDAQALASAANLGEVQVSIAAEVALDYITLRSAQARLAIATESLASQRETLQITQWRWQAGLVTSLDAEQARAAAEQTAASLPALVSGMAQTSHALSVLSGQPPAALLVSLGTPGPIPQAPESIALSLPAETLRQRPDVRAAEYQVRSALAQLGQAEAARWPSLSIGGSLGLGAATLGALTHGSAIVASVLGNVTLPLLDGGARRAQVSAQHAALDQAQQAYRATVLVALKDVEDALVAWRGDQQRLSHLLNAADAATSAARLARDQYSSGLVDFQTVLSAQRTQLGTQDSVASARADVSSDQVRLYKALGGGWPTETSQAMNITRATTP